MPYLRLPWYVFEKEGRDIANCEVKFDAEISSHHERTYPLTKRLTNTAYKPEKTGSAIKLYLGSNFVSVVMNLWTI